MFYYYRDVDGEGDGMANGAHQYRKGMGRSKGNGYVLQRIQFLGLLPIGYGGKRLLRFGYGG